MKNLRNLFDGIANLNGAKFITLNGYVSEKSGEIANHNILTNISVMNAKTKDFETLKNADVEVLSKQSKQGIALEIYKTALSEMLTSAEKNLSENIEDRTAQSQAQTDAYIHISNAIRLHKETGNIHIFGMAISKTVVKAGEPKKPVKSADKTIAKNEITKSLDLRAGKFRTFIVGNVETVKLNGETLEINCR